MHQQDPTLSQLSLFAATEGMDASVVKVAELSRHEDAERLQLLFERLSHSAFRSRFHLNGKDKLSTYKTRDGKRFASMLQSL